MKVKLTANRDLLSTSYYEKVLDAIFFDYETEKEIFESSKFKKSVSEMMISVDMLGLTL